jgi:hypothetical protein
MKRVEKLHGLQEAKSEKEVSYDATIKSAEREITAGVVSLAISLKKSLTDYQNQPSGFFRQTKTAADHTKHAIVKKALKVVDQTTKLKLFDVVKINAFFSALRHLSHQLNTLHGDAHKAKQKCDLAKLLAEYRAAIENIKADYLHQVKNEFLQFDIKILWLKLMLEEVSTVENDITNSWVKEYYVFLQECRNTIAKQSTDRNFFALLEQDLAEMKYADKIDHLQQFIKQLQQTRMMKDLYFNQYHLPEGNHKAVLLERHRMRELRDDLLLEERKVIYQWLKKAEDDYHQSDLDLLTKAQIEEFSDWVRARMHFAAINVYIFEITGSLRRSVYLDDILLDQHDNCAVADFLRLSKKMVKDNLQSVVQSRVDIVGVPRAGKRHVRMEEAWLKNIKTMSTFYLHEKDAEMVLFASELVASNCEAMKSARLHK